MKEDKSLLDDEEEDGGRNSIVVDKDKKMNEVEISPGYTIVSEMSLISIDSDEVPDDKWNSFIQSGKNEWIVLWIL